MRGRIKSENCGWPASHRGYSAEWLVLSKAVIPMIQPVSILAGD
ncbi:hypothetical protein [Hyphomicrobium sulfonivorans]|nr:hypothetical protein [Hyphomicrobium sulfonivorans]